MYYQASKELPPSGFNFNNCVRNDNLLNSGFKPLKCFGTGTTIVGILFRHGVILGADTRGTKSSMISEKRSFKIHRITSNIYCCGAGTAGDSGKICELAASQMRLLNHNTGRQIPVVAVVTHIKHVLYQFHGEIASAFVIGGIDYTGFHIYSAYPFGSTDKLPYITIGSGSLCAMSLIEPRWYPNMTKLKAVRLVRDAIKTGIYNDLASGGCVDICVITKKGAEYMRHLLTNPHRSIIGGNHPLNKYRRTTAKRNLQKYTISETVNSFDK